jgi:hypothetical protein
VVEGFVLPHGAGSSAEFIDAAGRGAFDRAQDFGKRETPAISVAECGEQQMHMIRHNHRGMDLDGLASVVEAVLQGSRACFGREFQGFLCAKRHE